MSEGRDYRPSHSQLHSLHNYQHPDTTLIRILHSGSLITRAEPHMEQHMIILRWENNMVVKRGWKGEGKKKLRMLIGRRLSRRGSRSQGKKTLEGKGRTKWNDVSLANVIWLMQQDGGSKGAWDRRLGRIFFIRRVQHHDRRSLQSETCTDGVLKLSSSVIHVPFGVYVWGKFEDNLWQWLKVVLALSKSEIEFCDHHF